jgi:signal transduction histidine kinase
MMSRPYRSLRAYAVIWLVLPLSALIAGLILTGVFAQRKLVTSLAVEQHRQLATFTAASISEVIAGYARVLEALAASTEMHSISTESRAGILEAASHSLEVFNAGVLVVDREGRTINHYPASRPPFIQDVAAERYFQSISQLQASTFSSTLVDDLNGESALVVAVPVVGPNGRFSGALLGALQLSTSQVGEPVRRLATSTDGYAYLVDNGGRVIFHPDPSQVGADFGANPAVQAVLSGESGGSVWETAGGERLVQGYAPLVPAGWGLVVQNSWEVVFAPLRTFTLLAGLAGLGAIALFLIVAWQGVNRVLAPIRLLSDQTGRLASGDRVADLERSEIAEIDGLENAFLYMAGQITDYRAGLRRYVGAITQSQEDERRHIARELHDETVQSLLAILRRLELAQASESDPERLQRLAGLQSVVTETLDGVRKIIKAMRPLVLEDLGLVPALKDLVRSAREGEGALPHARLNVSGPPAVLRPELELALYRITQETLTNVRKHALATGVRVDLNFLSDSVELEIADDGRGFTVPAALTELGRRGCFGLLGIQERVWAMEGELKIRSAPGQGTQLCVTLPVRDGTVK